MNYFKLILLSSIILFANACANNKYYDPNKKHHTKEGFKNLYIDDNAKKGGLFKYNKMKYFGDEYWSDHEEHAHEIEVIDVDVKLINTYANKPRITWLGHSTFLVQNKNTNVLTDPVFSDRVSPLCFVGPLRYVKHPMDYKNLPKIDYVIISHNHYDHLDKDSIKMLFERNENIKFFVPLGLKELFLDLEVKSEAVFEFDWADSKKSENIYVKALPSQHWSARGLFDKRETLWASWYLDFKDFDFWFAGDTGYNKIQFKEIGKELKQVDLAFIPIGAYAPRWFMKLYHVDTNEAVKIHKDVNAKKSIGMHWGTFPLTAEDPIEPKIKLEEELIKQNINKDEFITLKIGETIEL